MRGLQELSSEGAAALGKMKALQESLQREKERADGLDTKLKSAKVSAHTSRCGVDNNWVMTHVHYVCRCSAVNCVCKAVVNRRT